MPIVGTCSQCGGAVRIPDLWGGMVPPTPTCGSCGATAKNPWGPVIPMTPSPVSPPKRDTKRNMEIDRHEDDTDSWW